MAVTAGAKPALPKSQVPRTQLPELPAWRRILRAVSPSPRTKPFGQGVPEHFAEPARGTPEYAAKKDAKKDAEEAATLKAAERLESAAVWQKKAESLQKAGSAMQSCGCILTLLVTVPLLVIAAMALFG